MFFVLGLITLMFSLQETANCPVLFYISDKAEETEDVLIEKYVMQGFIVVTFNFRNGIFGFLNMVVSSDDAPFNVGFLGKLC